MGYLGGLAPLYILVDQKSKTVPNSHLIIQAVPLPTFCPAGYMQPPCVARSPLKNEVAVISTSPQSSIVRGDVICDTGWNQDIDTYPAYSAQWDAQVAWRSTFHRPRTVHDTLY